MNRCITEFKIRKLPKFVYCLQSHLLHLIATMDLALEQGEVEKRINAVQDEVKKQDDAIKELQKKLKVKLRKGYLLGFNRI